MSEDNLWEKLPLVFKKDVVKYLGFLDRCSLEKTCKYNHQFVKSTSIHLMQLGFTDRSPTINLHFQETPWTNDRGILQFSSYHVSGENIFQDFFRIFENPKSIVDILYFDLDKTDSKKWLAEFVEYLKDQPESFKIRAKSLNWIVETDHDELQIDIIKRLDKNCLQNVTLFCGLNDDSLKRFIETEQCQMTRRLSLGSICGCTLPLATFLYLNHIHVHVQRITSEEIWENFRSKPRPIGSRFHFYSVAVVGKLIEIQELLRLFDVTPHNSAPPLGQDRRYIQLFRTAFENKVLKVEITEKSVTGMILNNEDFDSIVFE